MKAALRQEMKADLISSEAVRRRFHPSLLGFHPAKQDFIKFVWLAGIVLSLRAFLFLAIKNKSFTLYPLSFNLWGIVQLLIRLKNY